MPKRTNINKRTKRTKGKKQTKKKKLTKNKSVIKNLEKYTKNYEMCVHKKCHEFNELNNELENELILIKSRLNREPIKNILKEYKKIMANFEKSTDYTTLKKECQCNLCDESFNKLNKLLTTEIKKNIDIFKKFKKEIKSSANNEDIKTIDDIVKLLKYIQRELTKSKC